jgi:LmbE family N-acetylglucosaminyl deacetylase
VSALVLASASLLRAEVSVQVSATQPGYNAGSTAVIRALVTGLSNADQHTLSAAISYAGAATASTVELKPKPESGAGTVYEGEWAIPADARTGLYTIGLEMQDPSSHGAVTMGKAPGFFVYKKLLRITSVKLDKAFYAPGDRIACEIGIENLTGQDLKGLRVEFSNENYPWISTFSGAANASGNMAVSPSLGLAVMRESLDVPAHGQANIPMQPAGTAAILQGANVAVMGAGGPARHEKVAPPEADRYTIAVWDHDRQNLLDMQFSTQVIVREPGQVLPKPYSRNFTHPYNSDIDYAKYRDFYPPTHGTATVSTEPSRTLYQPGGQVMFNARLGASLRFRPLTTEDQTPAPFYLWASIRGPDGKEVWSGAPFYKNPQLPPSEREVHPWAIPASAAPGVYTLSYSERYAPSGQVNAEKDRELNGATWEFAVNKLPASLMVFCPHEDDEHPWAGLMRAMVEAGRPVRVLFYTGGDVGECERYFDGHPCDPVRAREFGTVRMEESAEALEHIGVKRDQDMFLGLPDGGSGEIWFNHIQTTNPFLSIYLAVDHSPYENAYQPNLPYARDAVIEAVKRVITDFKPAMIAVSHPDERHVDHRTANWFTLKACQELLREKRIDPATVVLADQAYGSGGYKPAPYQYEKYVVYLSGEAAALKQEMGWIYQSQDGNLEEGSKKTYGELPREELHYRIVDWQQHEGWNE